MAAPDDAVAAFVGKWHAREPEMRIAVAFCPGPQRATFAAWGALLHELREAAFELSDPRVTAAKCAWWTEELVGWSAGRSRHPLGRVLAGCAAPWSALGEEWLRMPDLETRHDDTDGVLASLALPAQAVAAVEHRLFPVGVAPDPAGQLATTGRGIAVHWLASRLPAGLAAPDRGRVALHLVARHGHGAFAGAGPAQSALVRDWATELREHRPPAGQGTLFGRCRTAFDGARLARIARGQAGAPGPVGTLWRAWAAARAGT